MKKYFAVVIFLLFLLSCAQQNQPLTGGKQDSIAPFLKKSIPNYNDTSFFEKKISLKFNEYFSLKGLDAEFFSTTPFEEKPKFTISGKKLIISFKTPLNDSTTYTFFFGNTIVDYNEGNVLKNFEFTFSTYNKIDTLSISGHLIDAYTFKPISKAYIMLYELNDDSIPFKKIPDYIAKTDTSGFFQLKNLKNKYYKIFALDDLNNNYIFNEDENFIAFSDTLIKPWAELFTNYDTVSYDSLVPKIIIDSISKINKIDTIMDTLRIDTVIIKSTTLFYPNDVKLLMFTEKSAKQLIRRRYRDVKGGIKLSFSKKLINNYLELSSFESDSNNFQYHIENFQSQDSFYIWFTNPLFYDKDSIKFLVTYYLSDSIKTTDTISFLDYNYATDTLPLKLNIYRKNISNLDNFSFISYNPIANIDESKIKLFQIIDTTVNDELLQIISAIRPSKDSIVFAFARPTENFYAEFEEFSEQENLIKWRHNKTKDTVFCKILNENLIELDTIKLLAHYNNTYFFDQIIDYKTDLKIPLTTQSLVKVQRKTLDSVIFSFTKNLDLKNTQIELLNYNNNDFENIIEKNNLIIKLKSKKVISNDTLSFYIKTYDMLDDNNEKIYFEDTIKAIFKFNIPNITYSRRYYRSKIILVFNKSLLEIPELTLLSFNPYGKWYTITSNQNKDTINIDIINQRVMRLIDMKFKISYFDINQHADSLFFCDTLTTKLDKMETKSIEKIGNEKKLKIQKPIDFSIENDSVFMRKYNVITNYESGKNYILKIDSAVVKDIYNIVNDTVTYKFKVFSPKEFATIFIDIKNIQALISDTISRDSIDFYELPVGQGILIIEDENKEIYRTIFVNSDKTLRDQMFLPGKYTLKIFYDTNNNGVWDTGNYKEKTQPEKVFIYKHSLNLTEGKEEKIIWDLLENK